MQSAGRGSYQGPHQAALGDHIARIIIRSIDWAPTGCNLVALLPSSADWILCNITAVNMPDAGRIEDETWRL